jgi:Na+/H+-translocating membrane pyrophosphatase
VDLSDDAQAAFDARIKVLRRLQIRLLIIGAALTVLSPLIVALSVSGGLGWMRWFWVVSVGTFVAGLGLSIGTTTAERTRWYRAVREIAKTDLEQEQESRP